MDVTIIGPGGTIILCACGKPASGSALNSLGRQVYHCPEHDPAGPPCPLCEGSGHLAR